MAAISLQQGVIRLGFHLFKQELFQSTHQNSPRLQGQSFYFCRQSITISPKSQPLSGWDFSGFYQWRQPITCAASRALGTENPGVLSKKTADISVFLLWPRERSPGHFLINQRLTSDRLELADILQSGLKYEKSFALSARPEAPPAVNLTGSGLPYTIAI